MSSNLLVVIDSRELSSKEARKIQTILHSLNVATRIEVLEVGDYYIPPGEDADFGLVVERKEIIDLLNAAKTKRLWDQLRKLCEVENAHTMMIIEGSLTKAHKFTEWRPQSIAGLVASILLDFEIPVIQTPSYYWTGYMLYVLARRYQLADRIKYVPIRIRKKGYGPEDYAKQMLCSLPGINVGRAELILRRFGTVLDALNNVDAWKSLPKIGPKTVRKIKEVLSFRFT